MRASTYLFSAALQAVVDNSKHNQIAFFGFSKINAAAGTTEVYIRRSGSLNTNGQNSIRAPKRKYLGSIRRPNGLVEVI